MERQRPFMETGESPKAVSDPDGWLVRCYSECLCLPAYYRKQ